MTRAYLSIGDVLSLLREEFPDVTISKIRFLESQGLVNPERSPSGYRKFYDEDVDRLRWVLRQQREHFLPLKVIRDRLGRDGGVVAPAVATGSEMETETAPAAADLREPVSAGVRTGSRTLGHETHANGALHQVRAVERDRTDAPAAAVRPPLAVAPPVAHAGAPASDQSGAFSSLPPAREAGAGGAGGGGAGGGGVAVHAARPSLFVDAHSGEPRPGAGGSQALSPPGISGGDAAVMAAAARHEDRRPPERGTPSPTRAAQSEPPSPTPPPISSSTASPTPGPAPAASGPSSDRQEGRDAPAPAPSPASSPPVRVDTFATSPSVTGASLTPEELSAASGLSITEIASLEGFGLIESLTVAGILCYDEEALVVAKLVAEFSRYGIEPRHLRLYRNAVDREMGLVEQIVTPLLRQRNPEARQRAAEASADLARLGQGLRSSLLRLEMRRQLGS